MDLFSCPKAEIGPEEDEPNIEVEVEVEVELDTAAGAFKEDAPPPPPLPLVGLVGLAREGDPGESGISIGAKRSFFPGVCFESYGQSQHD